MCIDVRMYIEVFVATNLPLKNFLPPQKSCRYWTITSLKK